MTDIDEMVDRVLTQIGGLPGVTIRTGVSFGDLRMLERELEVLLPAAYEALLKRTNGLEVAHGRKRILGYGPGAPVDIVQWNEPETWKWAYRWLRDDLDDYVVFGATVDQTLSVCMRSDLQSPDNDPVVKSVQPSVPGTIGPGINFSAWIEQGIRYQANDPVSDDVDRQLLERFGEFPPDELLLDSPMLWVTGEDDIDRTVMLPAADAMIANADLQREAQRLEEGAVVSGIDTYEDERGRTRLRYLTERHEGSA